MELGTVKNRKERDSGVYEEKGEDTLSSMRHRRYCAGPISEGVGSTVVNTLVLLSTTVTDPTPCMLSSIKVSPGMQMASAVIFWLVGSS